MPQKLEQTQGQTQQQVLNPQQMLLVKLLELPVADLRQRVEDEIVENAALEEKGGDDEEPDTSEKGEETEPFDEEPVPDDRADYFSEDDVPDYMLTRQAADEERRERVVVEGTSFYENLRDQIGEHDLTEHERQLVEYLIGSLDDDGLLRKDLDGLVDELEIYHGVETSKEELTAALGILQTFEPKGIGARDLQQCLRLQLADPDVQKLPYRAEALRVVDNYFDDFTRKRWDDLRHRMKVDEETFDKIIHVLIHLNPRPGFALNEAASFGAEQVIPDFSVTMNDEGGFDIRLNDGDVPQLHVSRAFRDSIKQFGTGKKLSREQKEAYVYARQKVDAAQTFIKAIQQRREMLLSVMRTIVEMQRPFFEDGDELQLRPMVLKDVAERVGSSISTVSRVTGSKYVETDFGVFSLKHFFGTSYAAADGEELAARKVKIALKALIDAENKRKPLTDDALTRALKEQGITVARRTVAKYREQLGLPVARLRR